MNTNQSNDNFTPGQGLSSGDIIQKGIGFIVLCIGLYFGYMVFVEAKNMIHNPAPLEKWLKLRDKVHEKTVTKDKTPVKKRKGLTLFSDEQVRFLGGYFTLFLGLLFLWIIGRIALACLAHGAVMLSSGYRFKKKH